MQDGAPCHTAKSIMTWLADSKVPVLKWVGNPPDCNPIENLWRGQQLGRRQQSRRARRQDQEGVEEPGQEQDLPRQDDQLNAEPDRGRQCRQGQRDQVLGLVV